MTTRYSEIDDVAADYWRNIKNHLALLSSSEYDELVKSFPNCPSIDVINNILLHQVSWQEIESAYDKKESESIINSLQFHKARNIVDISFLDVVHPRAKKLAIIHPRCHRRSITTISMTRRC